MSDQPPHNPQTKEIDIRQILPVSDTTETHAPPRVVGDDFKSGQPSFGRNELLRSYDAIRIGWSGWANVIFAALASILGVFCTLRFFDYPEAVRTRHARASEYFYGRPVEVPDEKLEPIAQSVSASGGIGPVTGNSALPGYSQPLPAGASAPVNANPPFPTSAGPANPGLPASGERAPANSPPANTAAESRSTTASKAVGQKNVASKTRRATSKTTKGFAHHRANSRTAGRGIFAWLTRFIQMRGKSTAAGRGVKSSHISPGISQKGMRGSNGLSSRNLAQKTTGLTSGSIRGAAIRSTSSNRGGMQATQSGFGSSRSGLGTAGLGLGRGGGHGGGHRGGIRAGPAL